MLHSRTLAALEIAMFVSMIGPNAKATPNVSVESPLVWLHVAPANDPQFAALAKEAVGQESLAALTDVLPYSVVLTNQGTATVVGIAVRFRITKGNNTTINRDFFYYSFPEPNTPILSPGQRRLLTPLTDANAVALGQVKPSARRRSVDEAQMLADFGTTQDLHVIVDLIISQDGRTAGSDGGHNAQRLTAQAQAHYDMTRDALARLNRDNDAQVTEWLTSVAQQQLSPQSIGQTTKWYASVQKTLANAWVTQIRNGKRAELVSKLALITSTEDKTFVFLKALHGGLQ